MPSVILTVVIGALIFFYAGWVIYKSVERTKEGKSCCGGCSDCSSCEYKNKSE